MNVSFKKKLEKIIDERLEKIFELERSLDEVKVIEIGEDSTLNPTMRTLDDCNTYILHMAKTYLILEMPFSHIAELDFIDAKTPDSEVESLTGPYVWEAIHTYLDQGRKINDAEYERRLSLIEVLNKIKALPKELKFEGDCSPLPIKIYMKYYPPELVEWRIRHYLKVMDSTKDKYISQFRNLVNEMSRLSMGCDYESNQKEWEVAPSLVAKKRKKKDQGTVPIDYALVPHYFAQMIVAAENDVLHDTSVDQSSARNLLILLLLFYAGMVVDTNGHMQVSIQEVINLKVSQIGFKRCIVHFSKCKIHCPKNFIKLLRAYMLTRGEYVFVDSCKSSPSTTWVNHLLSRMQNKLGEGKNDLNASGEMIVPSSILKSALRMRRSLLYYGCSLEKMQIMKNCKKAGE